MKNFRSLAIDGGAGTGKSTLSNLISDKNNYLYVETGSHYRALTWMMMGTGIVPEQIDKYLESNFISIDSKIFKNKAFITINGQSFSKEELRSPEVNRNVSRYAAIPALRKLLFDYQRSQVELAKKSGFNGAILEGRDIGTKILPEADLKVFLWADLQIRVQRRSSDGETDSITKRDKMDMNRKEAPLACAEGAIKINTGQFSPDEVYMQVMRALDLLQ
jgi:cytidylate kinase